MAETEVEQDQELLAKIELSFDAPQHLLAEFSPVEVVLSESLLTPGLQSSVRVHAHIHNLPLKNYDQFKGVSANIKIERAILERFGFPKNMEVQQTVYRLDNRKMINTNNEEFILHMCDPTLLNDAATLVSKSWKCTRPSEIVEHVLRSCAGAKKLDIEQADPARDYIAENIHPFQVVHQQAQVALAQGNDPSFVHFMTYENLGTHHFKSLKKMTEQTKIIEYVHAETGASFAHPKSIMHYNFPCDFDLLSDILNGIGLDGKDINSLAVFNPVNKSFSLLGNQTVGCGIGGGQTKTAITNYNTAKNQNSCPSSVEQYLLKRQARMALLEKDKIALRLTVPWNPILHAGKVIEVSLYNKEDESRQIKNYGSGEYLIVNMIHNIKSGGYSTTTMDCVSKTVGRGEV